MAKEFVRDVRLLWKSMHDCYSEEVRRWKTKTRRTKIAFWHELALQKRSRSHISAVLLEPPSPFDPFHLFSSISLHLFSSISLYSSPLHPLFTSSSSLRPSYHLPPVKPNRLSSARNTKVVLTLLATAPLSALGGAAALGVAVQKDIAWAGSLLRVLVLRKGRSQR